MKNVISYVVIGLSIIVSVTILSNTYKNRYHVDDVISVTGLGSKDFTSDLIVWSGSFSKKNYELQAAYEMLKNDREIIKEYLASKGIKSDEILFSAVDINNEFDYYYDAKGNRNSTFSGYRLTQKVEIESKEVNKVEKISREVTDLINSGVEFYSYDPQYYYTKLSELKIEMIAAATEDARIRAEQIAQNANASIGNLKEARMGIFQIIAQNSNDDYSWGGTFNTSSKKKTATITIKLKFGVN